MPIGSVSTDGVGIDGQPVPGRKRAARSRGPRRGRCARPAPGFAAEQDVLPHAQPVDELEVLVDEADGAVRLDRAGVRFHRAECDRRQGRFAGAVFADERVDFARQRVEVDAVDRRDRAEAFADPAQAQRRLSHARRSSSSERNGFELGQLLARRRRLDRSRDDRGANALDLGRCARASSRSWCTRRNVSPTPFL